jgi:hypothetical protein
MIIRCSASRFISSKEQLQYLMKDTLPIEETETVDKNLMQRWIETWNISQ